MITQNLGQEDLAERTLDLYTAGVLAEYFEERIEPKQEWKDLMDRLSIISCDAYRGVVKGIEYKICLLLLFILVFLFIILFNLLLFIYFKIR
jgi:hypothetical protein